MDLSKVTFLKIDIEDRRLISFFRRNGPLYNVSVPKKEYLFLKENGYTIRVRRAILEDGSEVGFDEADAPEAEAIETPQQAVQETPQVEVTEPEPESAPNAVEPEVDEPASEETVETHPPENLMDTIETTDDDINLRLLTLEQYSLYTKAELHKFLKALSSSLPDEISSQVENDRSLTKRGLLEIIEQHLLAD